MIKKKPYLHPKSKFNKTLIWKNKCGAPSLKKYDKGSKLTENIFFYCLLLRKFSVFFNSLCMFILKQNTNASILNKSNKTWKTFVKLCILLLLGSVWLFNWSVVGHSSIRNFKRIWSSKNVCQFKPLVSNLLVSEFSRLIKIEVFCTFDIFYSIWFLSYKCT